MKVVKAEDLRIIKKFNYGAFSDVFLVEYDNHIFCYKHFNTRYPNDILNNISKLGDLDTCSSFITPTILIEHNNRLIGYLSNYNKDLEELDFVTYKTNQIFYLKQTKELIEKLHNDYGRIHGDVSSTNVLVDKENRKSYLIDFDSSLYLNQSLESRFSFSTEVLDFIYKYRLEKATEGIDIYKFNITTLMLLYGIDDVDLLFYKIEKNKLHNSKVNKDIKVLTKELLLESRNPYSNQYIIDYI